MDRIKFTQNFSRRLIQLMQQKGLESSRAKSGVDVNKLAKVCDCSYQMARKYTISEALPELHTIVKIAEWLETSPSWLLFGEDELSYNSNKTGAIIEIEPSLLKYILKKSYILFTLSKNIDEIVNFIVDTTYDATHLSTDIDTIHRIIDMMISSATLLHNDDMDLKSA